MAPGSCLVDIATSQRRKKRVRFRDELTAANPACGPPFGPGTIGGLDMSPCLAALPPGSSNQPHGSPTYGSDVEPWIVRSPLADTWRPPPDLISGHVGHTSQPDGGVPTGGRGGAGSSPDQWWWSHKVASIGVSAPLTVLPSVPCRDAVDIMLQEGFDQVPIVDQLGELLGIVTLRSLMTSLVVQRALPSTLVGEVMCTELWTLSRDQSLLELSKILQRRHCALIVHSQRRLTEKGQVAKKAVVIGIVTPTDLLAYIMRNSLS